MSQPSTIAADNIPTLRAHAQRVFALQRENRWRIATTTGAERAAKLTRLRAAIEEHREALQDAMWRDFRKHRVEVEITEIQTTLIELEDARRNVGRWMRPRRVATPLILAGTRGEVQYEPRGVVLIMAPWNYPFNLVFAPLIAAVAAGNCAIIRPSEKVPHTAAVIARIIGESFDESEVACLTEAGPGVELATELLALPFDHIFFTGSIPVGKLVMAAAATHLASVTLELGGKSPLIVDEAADVGAAANRGIWGKFVNGGQTCIAPDYALVHESRLPAFLEAAKRQIARLYGDTEEARHASPDLARIIDDAAFARLSRLLEQATAAGAKVEIGGRTLASERYIAPTLLSGVEWDSPIMREEIFGPILPVLPFRSLDEVPERIHRIGKPLALYLFSRNERSVEFIRQRTSSGGIVINNVLIHFGNPNLPFGGVGESGQGSYHGVFGFRAFSHERSVLRQTPLGAMHLVYPPYGSRAERVLRLMGKLVG